MLITFISLKYFRPFIFNNVELLELEITKPIQNVIGTNGSGKSSLLRELNPRPAIRSNYNIGGHKIVHLVHEGKEYHLISDFSIKEKSHSFKRNGEELNLSGTTQLQEELVRKELGYTPHVHTVCYGEQRLSSIRVGLRETYLLTIHPCQMRFILDKHTSVEKKIRGFTSNLSMLHERHTALSSQIMDTNLRAEIQEESNKLSNEVAIIIGSLHKLNSQRQQLISNLKEHSSIHKTRSIIERKQKQRRYPLFSQIDRDVSLDELRTAHLREISSLQTQRTTITRHIQSLASEINKYEQHLNQNNQQGMVDLLESTIETLQSDINKLDIDKTDCPFESYHLDNIPVHLDRLTEMIGAFIDYGGNIPALKDVSRLEAKYEQNFRAMTFHEQELEWNRNKLSIAAEAFHQQLCENIPDSCSNCVLFQQYKRTTNGLQLEYDRLKNDNKILERKVTRLNWLVTKRHERLNTYRKIVPQMQRLSSYLNEYQFLLIPLRGFDILSLLRHNPASIIVRIQSHYERSKNHHLKIKKQIELEKRKSEYERLKTPSEYSRQFLESMVVEKQTQLTLLRQDYDSICQNLIDKEQFLSLLIEYTLELNILQQEQRTLEQKKQYENLKFDKEICDNYILSFEEAKTKTVLRLSEIDRVLREQDSLMARHQEIIDNITGIESQLKELILFEKALSPTTGIPYRYMVQFINELIGYANDFIKDICSYPFEFIPVALGDPLDYRFRMRVSETPIPDISECSEAQREIGDLAFRLAQIVLLKQTNYGIYLDEIDKTFDAMHRQRLLTLLKSLIDDGVTPQLFLINHNVSVYSGMKDTDILVLNESNIVVPPIFNQNAHIVYY